MKYYWIKYPVNYPTTVTAPTQLIHIGKRLKHASSLLVSQGFKVERSGTSHGSNMTAWFVVKDGSSDIAALRGKLGPLSKDVPEVREIKDPAEGATLGKQLELF